jgi:hypothetical protein
LSGTSRPKLKNFVTVKVFSFSWEAVWKRWGLRVKEKEVENSFILGWTLRGGVRKVGAWITV